MKNRKRSCTLIVLAMILFLSWLSGAPAQPMIADIDHDVHTDFGTYRPYPAEFTPHVPSFTVEPDFSNVPNFTDVNWSFTSSDTTLLLQNHFTVKKSHYKQLYDIYNICTWHGTPVCVTTDAVLHTYHVLFDNLLAEIEVQRFVVTLDELTGSLIDGTESLRAQVTEPLAQEALLRNLAFLYVGKKLLNGSGVIVPEDVSTMVDDELTLISNHDGYHVSPIFGNFSELDYSQFQPRGHYTKNDTLESYFRTMMWYGWTIFTMEPELFGDLASRHTLQALLLVQMLYALESNGTSLIELWEGIYEPTVFFVGKTDDPYVRDYKNIADQIYGLDFLHLSPDSLADMTLLNDFMTEAQTLPVPAIPNWVYGTFIQYKGFRFMGQRFVPDSYMFAHLVMPEVDGRLFPKGLDIMAILGSERAYTLLDSVYGETSYPNYAAKISEFNSEFSNKPSEAWAQNLYWNWLYCLMPLLYGKGSGYPSFMQTLAWADKELMTALASWAELRHDTILYVKQSTTPRGSAPGPPKSYVEPNPHLYARLASLVRYTRDGLQAMDALPEGFQDKLDLFETLLLFLRDVSIKELENVPLLDSEYDNIFCFGKVMQYLVSDCNDPRDLWDSSSDDMAVVADVHTDSNTDLCLEEAVGYCLELFVIVNEGGSTRITRGAAFSYYEFTQPIGDRLTDEAWRKMLDEHAQPPMPEWFASFMDPSTPQPQFSSYSPMNLYEGEFTGTDHGEEDVMPEAFYLFQNYPNPFNAFTDIRYQVVDSRYPAYTTLEIYNILGQKVVTLFEGQKDAGFHVARWDGTTAAGQSVPSGIYICRLEVGEFSQSRKLVLLK